MNKIILIGNLCRDIEMRYTSTNKAVATTTIAVSRNYTNEKGERETDFVNIVVWGNQAENLQKYCSKGSKIALDGRLQIRNYEDQNGNKKYITEVVAENVQFLDTKKKEEESSVSVKESTNPFEEFAKEISEEELPF